MLFFIIIAFAFLRTGLDRCLKIAEQGNLVRDDIEDMLRNSENRENRNSEPAEKNRRAAVEQTEGLTLKEERVEEKLHKAGEL